MKLSLISLTELRRLDKNKTLGRGGETGRFTPHH